MLVGDDASYRSKLTTLNRNCLIAWLAALILLQTLPYVVTWAENADRLPIPLQENIHRYQDAHRRSQSVRASVQQVEALLAGQGSRNEEVRLLINRTKQEYFSARADLFVSIYAHASSIVQTSSNPSPAQSLREIALTLAAASDFIATADAVMTSMSAREQARTIWNEQDEAHAIPAGSLETDVAADLNTNLTDMFRAGLPKLEASRADLEKLLRQAEPSILALFPDGVEKGLDAMRSAYRTLRAQAATADLAQDQIALRALVDRSTQERARWRRELAAVSDRLKQEQGIVRGDVHVRLNKIKRSFLDIREGLFPLAFKHVGIVTREDIAYPTDLRLQAIGLSLLAAATMYENASLLREKAASVPGLRDLLNQPDPALGIPKHFWDHIEREYERTEYRELFAAGLKALDDGRARSQKDDPFLLYVRHELDQMTAGTNTDKEPLEQRLLSVLRVYEKKTLTTGLAGVEQGKIQTSKGFGNFVGAFELRKGKLYRQGQWAEFVKQRAKPGDILLEKTPFRITDKFIPGHFGHVALYVGSEEQVRNLGLLREAAIAKFQPQLAEGRMIVEALREGTQINTIEHFLNIDDLAILRPKPEAISLDDVLQAITLAFAHIGKKYDFGFDTNTWDTIVCSELAFQTYVNIQWPFGKTLGSYTISPDDVAVMAGKDASLPFQLISFVHDGNVVSDTLTRVEGESVYRSLIEQDRVQKASLLPFFPNPATLLKPIVGTRP